MIKSCSLCLKKTLFCLNVFFLKGFKFNTHTFSIVIKCINYKKYSYNSTQHKNFQTGMLPQLLLSWHFWKLSSVQFSHSVVSDSLRPHGLQHARPPCPSPTPGASQTLVHWVGDAIQPSYPLSSPSPAFSPSQHQGLFQWDCSLHQVAKVLEFQLQHQSFQWIFRADFLQDWLVGSPCSPKDSQESFPTPHFKSISSLVLSPSLWSIYYIYYYANIFSDSSLINWNMHYQYHL